MTTEIAPVPLVIVSGTLGAGKTTFINEILRRQHKRRLAAVVNDFGSINIDAAILAESGQPIYSLENGCVCCTLQGDLIRTLRNVLTLDCRLDGIVIEASGLSDARGIPSALQDPFLAKVAAVETLLTVVDAGHRDCADPLWRTQIEAADYIYLSKTDDLPEDGERVQAALLELGRESVFRGADLPALADGILFTEITASPTRSRFLAAEALPPSRIIPLEWQSEVPIRLAALKTLVEDLGSSLFRAKGLMRFAEAPNRPMLFQLSGSRATLSPLKHDVDGAVLILFGSADGFDAADVRKRLDTLSDGHLP